MFKNTWSMQTAQSRFSEIVAAADRKPQVITKDDKPAVVVMNVAEYERLRRLQRARAPSFSDMLLAIPRDDGEFSRSRVRPRNLTRPAK